VVCDFLERLPPGLVIHRLTGDAPPDYLVAPAWCLDKQGALRAIAGELQRRDSRQGAHWTGRGGSSERRKPGRLSLPVVSGER
jgi:radical SAM superfamily enzyme